MTVDVYKMAGEGNELHQLQLELEFSMASKQNVVCAILLCIVYTCNLASANSGAQQKPVSVVLKGKVVCRHACSLDEENFLGTRHIISGAAVAVECNGAINRKMNSGLVSIKGETDKNGEFKVELPSSMISSILLSSSDKDHSSSLKGYCSARLLRSRQEKCNLPYSSTSSTDRLIFTSDGNGIRTFTFPSLSYHPQSKLCSHKNIIISTDHESLQAGRALHEVSTGSSNDMDALFPHGNLPPLPKPKLGFPPFDLPHPPPQPFWNFPHFHASFPPAGIPFPGSSNDKDALFPDGILPPLPKPKLTFPPLDLPQPPPLPKSTLGLPRLDLPHSPPQPFLNFPPLPASIPPLPVGIPIPRPPPFPSKFPPEFHANP